MPQLKVRYNTEHNGSKLKWRAILMPGWEEHLAENIYINVPTETTEDTLPDGRVKHHVTMNYTNLHWDGLTLTIT